MSHNTSATCSASPRSGRATARPWAAWWTAARPASPSPRRTSRRPRPEASGQSRFTTQRREPDQVRILSGVFEDERTGGPVTTGTPIALLIENVDQRSKDYSEIRDSYRPGHADYAYDVKYGVRDYRAAGAPPPGRPRPGSRPRHRPQGPAESRARGDSCRWARTASTERWDWDEVRQPTPSSAGRPRPRVFAEYLDGIRKRLVRSRGDRGGGRGVRGSGRPSTQARRDLRSAIMSINAVKGVEIGDGFRRGGAHRRGERRRDAAATRARRLLATRGGGARRHSRSGQPVSPLRREATSRSSRPPPRSPAGAEGPNILTKGRHDPWRGIRAVRWGEAMTACVLADAFLRHDRCRCGIGRVRAV
jgi:chorismate synthase